MTLVTRQAMTDDSGLFTDGTVWNEAAVDQLYDQIDDQNHTTTNPTVKPKAITDEVVAARGSKASLDARLDVSLEEDGTLKSGAQAVTLAQLKSIIGSVNVIKNSELDDWSNGAALAPDDFTLSSLTVARTATTLNAGQYMARLTRSGGVDGFMYQDVIAAADFANYSLIAELGLKFSFSLRVKAGIASFCRITVDDGVTTTSSSYHTGGGADETLTVTHTIAGAATRLRIRVDLNTSNGDADVGGFIAAFSDVAITSWKPLTLPPLATATRRGLVSTAAQTLGAGTKAVDKLTYKPGGVATFDANASGRILGPFVTSRDTSGVNETSTIATAPTIKANTLNASGDVFRATYVGIASANAQSRTWTVKLGGTTITTINFTPNATAAAWRLTIEILRTSASNAQIITTTFVWSENLASSNKDVVDVQSTTKDLATDLTLDVTFQNAVAGTLSFKGAWFQVIGA